MKKLLLIALVIALAVATLSAWSTMIAQRPGVGTASRKANAKNDTTAWFSIGKASKTCNIWYRCTSPKGVAQCSLALETRYTNDSLYSREILRALADSATAGDTLRVKRLYPDSTQVSSFRTIFYSLKADSNIQTIFIEER